MRPALLLCLAAAPARGEVTVTSTHPDLQIARAEVLAPPDTPSETTCLAVLTAPATPAGQTAEALGWRVVSELPLGDLTALGLAAGAEPGPRGTCWWTGGQVALYDDTRLIARVTSGEGVPLGPLRPLGATGIRLLDGDPPHPSLADLQRDGDALNLTPPAAEEPVCQGRATLPFVEGLPIDAARARVLDQGWTIVPFAPDADTTDQTRALAARGLPEVAQCDSTGPAFCTFRYTSPAGALTLVTSAEPGENGSLPFVVATRTDCASDG